MGNEYREEFDYAALRKAVRDKGGGAGLDRLSAETGVSKSTLSRVLNPSKMGKFHSYNGKRGHLRYAPSFEVVARLCNWLGQPLETYKLGGGVPPTLEGLELIDAVLMRDPNLTRDQAESLSDMLRSAYKTLTRKENPHGKDGDGDS